MLSILVLFNMMCYIICTDFDLLSTAVRQETILIPFQQEIPFH